MVFASTLVSPASDFISQFQKQTNVSFRTTNITATGGRPAAEDAYGAAKIEVCPLAAKRRSWSSGGKTDDNKPRIDNFQHMVEDMLVDHVLSNLLKNNSALGHKKKTGGDKLPVISLSAVLWAAGGKELAELRQQQLLAFRDGGVDVVMVQIERLPRHMQLAGDGGDGELAAIPSQQPKQGINKGGLAFTKPPRVLFMMFVLRWHFASYG